MSFSDCNIYILVYSKYHHTAATEAKFNIKWEFTKVESTILVDMFECISEGLSSIKNRIQV